MGSSARKHTLRETARYLKISESEVKEMARKGKIHSSMNGSTRVFHLDFDPKRNPKYKAVPPPA